MPPRAKNAHNEVEAQENLRVAARIREVRLLGGHHLKTIAKQIGLTYQAYSRYEQGEPLTYGRLVQIARALGVPVEHLLELADGPGDEDLADTRQAMFLARLFLELPPARRALLRRLAAELSGASVNEE